ncbi:MAG: SDR family oxidoreductase [Verrucomicrobiota bacterium]
MAATKRYRCAVITGASSGLGEEFARQLAGRARHLVLVARRKEAMEFLAGRLTADFPELEVTVCNADLATTEGRERLLAMLAAVEVVPDLLVNNAGLGDYGSVLSADWEKVAAMLKVNVEALTHLTHAMVPGMVAAGGGVVVNVSSLASLLPIPDFAVYAATKAYVTSFSEALRIELKRHGVQVIALCPGPVHTEFGAVARRKNGGRSVPGREWFYVPKEKVVADAIGALEGNKARLFPGWKTAAAALVISALPLGILRTVQSVMRK